MNILLTSVGRRTYLVNYFKKELKNRGKVYVSNSSPISPAFNAADGKAVTPLIYDKNYIPFLLNYCKEKEIKIIIPLFDIDLYILSLNKEKFSEIGTDVIVSSSDFIKICNDKWLTYKYLKENNINTPNTYLNIEDFKVDEKNKKVKFPVIIKPRWGMGSLLIYTAENYSELKILYKKIQKQIPNSYIKYESQTDIKNDVIIQELINFQEYGMDIINDLNGKYQTTVVRKKIGMRSGETDCAKVLDDKELIKLGQQLSKITGHIGNLDVDVLYDGKVAYVLEMNARFGGGYPFSYMAGVNLPKSIIEWERKIDNFENLRVKEYGLYQKDISIIKLEE